MKLPPNRTLESELGLAFLAASPTRSPATAMTGVLKASPLTMYSRADVVEKIIWLN